MKPNPLVALNHFTVPVVMILLLSGVMPESAPYEPHVAVMTLARGKNPRDK
jgi:hypothetical protein